MRVKSRHDTLEPRASTIAGLRSARDPARAGTSGPDRTDPRQYCPYDTHSVDLSLGDEIVIPEPGTYSFDLSQREPLGPFLARNSRRVLIHAETVFPLKPQQFILGKTREYVSLPIDHPTNTETCLAARIEGKKSPPGSDS